jgi:hypothetical protein
MKEKVKFYKENQRFKKQFILKAFLISFKIKIFFAQVCIKNAYIDQIFDEFYFRFKLKK